MVAVAQLVEHQIVVLVVVGSIPIGHPQISPEFSGLILFFHTLIGGCHILVHRYNEIGFSKVFLLEFFQIALRDSGYGFYPQ